MILDYISVIFLKSAIFAGLLKICWRMRLSETLLNGGYASDMFSTR